MKDMMDKVVQLKSKYKGLIQVDGGINKETAVIAAGSGVDVLVAGTAVFWGRELRGCYTRVAGINLKQLLDVRH